MSVLTSGRNDGRSRQSIAPAAGGHHEEMTFDDKQLVKEEQSSSVQSSTRRVSDDVLSASCHSAEEDDVIEVFRFDRNSLKLRCEEISPKDLKSKKIGLVTGTITPGSNGKNDLCSTEVVKIEGNSSSISTDSSSSSSSSSSDSDSDSSSSSGGSSSSSSSSSSSNSSSSSSSKKTTPTLTSTFSCTSNSCIKLNAETTTLSNTKNKKKVTSASSNSTTSSSTTSSTSSSSSSSSSSSPSETENASDYEDELESKNKRRKMKHKRPPALGGERRESDLIRVSKNGSLTHNTLISTPVPTAPSVAYVKVERDEKDEGAGREAPFCSPSDIILKTEKEDDEEMESEGDGMVNIEDLVEGRNKQRKNSKWGDYVGARKSSRLAPRASFSNKNYEAQIKKRLRALLKKPASEWTDDDRTTMQSFPKLKLEVEQRIQKKEVASERLKESEDPVDIFDTKCAQLASVISHARYLIIYTGAGISTSAKIPDYRGPNGIWTLLQKGEQVTQSLTDISQTADPTLTHMAIKTLYDHQICKHVVSQNVDGLHLRSGIPKVALSEVHGNMYIEACTKCGREFVRLFDVTENTRRHHHKTGRFCYHCGTPLRDTVVLFGEKGSLRWPLNWQGAEYNVDKADVILCLGSSLKVLRRYPWLWSMAKPPQKRPKLYIVNLQWTPKDQFAELKINGKCDEVMGKVMALLNLPIPPYGRESDSIFSVATHLHPSEIHTKSSSELWYPSDAPYPEKNKDLRNYIRFEPVFKVPIPYNDPKVNVVGCPKKVKKLEVSLLKRENDEGSGDEESDNEDDERQGNRDDTEALSLLALKQEREEKAKQRKRILKGNNFSWLGNTVISKLQKKRKLK